MEYKLDENNILLEDDPIFEKLDKLHDEDNFDEILNIVNSIPRENWNNRIWFRFISALNNKRDFYKARQEIKKIKPYCIKPEDIAKRYYVLGFIYFMEDKELAALNLYKKAIKADPNDIAGLNLQEDCENCEEFIKGDFDNMRETFGNVMKAISDRIAENPDNQKESLEENQFAIIISLLSGFKKITETDLNSSKKLFFKYNEEEKEIVSRWFFDNFEICDYDSLMDICLNNFDLFKNFNSCIEYIKTGFTYGADNLNEDDRYFFDCCIRFVDNIKSLLPEDISFIAWDISETVGFVRQAYACDIISNSDFAATIKSYVELISCKYNSWYDYIASLVVAAGFFIFINNDFDIKASTDFMETTALLFLNSNILDFLWYKCESDDDEN